MIISPFFFVFNYFSIALFASKKSRKKEKKKEKRKKERDWGRVYTA